MDWLNLGGVITQHTAPVITVNVKDRDSLLRDLGHRMRAGQGFSIATLNLDHVVKMRNSAQFRTIYSQHSHITADGNPIVWLSRLAGQDVELVPGSELVRPVLELAARLDVPVALFGTTDATLEQSSQKLCREIPGLRIVSRLSPPKNFDPETPAAEEFIEALAASGARLTLLALGAPKQETFAIRAGAQLENMGFLSIGAGLDFIAGTQVRAPWLVRALAAEWLWRLASNPARFARRYAFCIAILPGLTRAALQARQTAAPRREP